MFNTLSSNNYGPKTIGLSIGLFSNEKCMLCVRMREHVQIRFHSHRRHHHLHLSVRTYVKYKYIEIHRILNGMNKLMAFKPHLSQIKQWLTYKCFAIENSYRAHIYAFIWMILSLFISIKVNIVFSTRSWFVAITHIANEWDCDQRNSTVEIQMKASTEKTWKILSRMHLCTRLDHRCAIICTLFFAKCSRISTKSQLEEKGWKGIAGRLSCYFWESNDNNYLDVYSFSSAKGYKFQSFLFGMTLSGSKFNWNVNLKLRSEIPQAYWYRITKCNSMFVI